MKSWLRRKRAWVDFRRWQREGFLRAFRRWRLYSQILKTPPEHTKDSDGDTELHLLCYRNDYLGAIWALKTFYRCAQVPVPLSDQHGAGRINQPDAETFGDGTSRMRA